MQLWGPSGTRNEWLDRNPTQIQNGGVGNVAGGGTTVVVTYVVPAGRRARIEAVHAETIVTTALAAGQLAVADADNGVGAASYFRLKTPAASALAVKEQMDAGPFQLLAGQTFKMSVTVTAGVGAVDWAMAMTGVEYDV